jgi:hypothetical protein
VFELVNAGMSACEREPSRAIVRWVPPCPPVTPETPKPDFSGFLQPVPDVEGHHVTYGDRCSGFVYRSGHYGSLTSIRVLKWWQGLIIIVILGLLRPYMYTDVNFVLFVITVLLTVIGIQYTPFDDQARYVRWNWRDWFCTSKVGDYVVHVGDPLPGRVFADPDNVAPDRRDRDELTACEIRRRRITIRMHVGSYTGMVWPGKCVVTVSRVWDVNETLLKVLVSNKQGAIRGKNEHEALALLQLYVDNQNDCPLPLNTGSVEASLAVATVRVAHWAMCQRALVQGEPPAARCFM